MRNKTKQQQHQQQQQQYRYDDAYYFEQNFGFLDFGVHPSGSYSFVQDLHRAKLESLRLQKERELEQQMEKDFAVQIEMAQKASLEEQKKRSVALNRLEKRLSCPWNLKINPNTDDTGQPNKAFFSSLRHTTLVIDLTLFVVGAVAFFVAIFSPEFLLLFRLDTCFDESEFIFDFFHCFDSTTRLVLLHVCCVAILKFSRFGDEQETVCSIRRRIS